LRAKYCVSIKCGLLPLFMIKNILYLGLGLVLLSCTEKSPFEGYALNTEPVILDQGGLSHAAIEWNNAYLAKEREIYYTQMGAQNSEIWFRTFKDGSFVNPTKVNLPEEAPHSDVYVDPLGDFMLFSSSLATSDEDSILDFNIWSARRDENGNWGEPMVFLEMEGNQFYPWLSANHNLYFSHFPLGQQTSDLYMREFDYDIYARKVSLGPNVNSFSLEGDAFVSADESFLIFAAFDRPGGLGKSDLYISFREDGIWEKPIWLGNKINSPGYDGSPVLSDDERFLIFTSSRGSSDTNTLFNHYIIPFQAEEWRL